MRLERPRVIPNDRSPVRWGLDRRDVEAHGAILQVMAPHELARQGDELALLGDVNAGLGRWIGVSLGAGLDLDDRDRTAVGRFGHDVDFAAAVAKVSRQDAIALTTQVTSHKAFADHGDGPIAPAEAAEAGNESEQLSHEAWDWSTGSESALLLSILLLRSHRIQARGHIHHDRCHLLDRREAALASQLVAVFIE